MRSSTLQTSVSKVIIIYLFELLLSIVGQYDNIHKDMLYICRPF